MGGLCGGFRGVIRKVVGGSRGVIGSYAAVQLRV